jgi:uridine kinase
MKEPIDINEAYFKLAHNLFNEIKLSLKKNKFIIGVSGESGSGKTVTGYCLNKILEDKENNVAYIQMDDYFHLPPATNHENRLKSLGNVGPREVNLALLNEHLLAFKNNEIIIAPEVDFASNKFLSKTLDFDKKTILVVEGTYIPLLEHLDLLIFLDVDYKSSLDNRIKRGREAFDPFVEKVLDIEHSIIKEFKSKADIIIDRNYTIQKADV